jgi:monoamine oxidase
MKEVFDAVVVGAGYAGLAAARKLTEEGCSTVVLEARDRVGGRAHTVEEAGARVDLGGQWIGPGQDHIHALAAETGVATFPQRTAGEDVVLEDGRPLRVSGEEGYDLTTSTSTARPWRRSTGRRPTSHSTARGRRPTPARSTR